MPRRKDPNGGSKAGKAPAEKRICAKCKTVISQRNPCSAPGAKPPYYCFTHQRAPGFEHQEILVRNEAGLTATLTT